MRGARGPGPYPAFCTFLVLITCLNLSAAAAQETPAIHGVFPHRVIRGVEVELVLRGECLRRLGPLTGARIRGSQIPVLEYEVLYDKLSRARLSIPAETKPGETEITFLFEGRALETPLVVIDEREREMSPVIRQVEPQDGQVGTDTTLFFKGTGLSRLGALGAVIVGHAEIPVIDHRVESDETMAIVVSFLPETTPGRTTINAFFENGGFEGPFEVRGPGPIEPRAPVVHRLDPPEARLDADSRLVLAGEGLGGLGELREVLVAGTPVPIRAFAPGSDSSLEVTLYLPPELPAGDTRIAFIFENLTFEAPFTVRGEEPAPPEEPTVPPGEPPLPPGGARAPQVTGMEPRQGEVNADVELVLEGEELLGLGDLVDVRVAGVDIPVQYYEVQSNGRSVVRVRLPAETPLGDQWLVFLFENAEFARPFTVTRPADGMPAAAAAAVVVAAAAVGSGLMVRRYRNRRRKPRGKTVDFDAKVEPGIQRITPAHRSLTTDLKLGIEVEVDQGIQRVAAARQLVLPRFDLGLDVEVDQGIQTVEADGGSILARP